VYEYRKNTWNTNAATAIVPIQIKTVRLELGKGASVAVDRASA
jgi:hypothetical protein